MKIIINIGWSIIKKYIVSPVCLFKLLSMIWTKSFLRIFEPYNKSNTHRHLAEVICVVAHCGIIDDVISFFNGHSLIGCVHLSCVQVGIDLKTIVPP